MRCFIVKGWFKRRAFLMRFNRSVLVLKMTPNSTNVTLSYIRKLISKGCL